MKKLLLTLLLTIFISSNCFAFKNAYEPESDTAASFSSHDIFKNAELNFVKYATLNSIDNEYWLRLSVRKSNNRILHYSTLTLDTIEVH